MFGIKTMKWLEKRFQNEYAVYGAIAFIAVIAYCNSFFVPFLLDDFGSITNNYSIHKLFDFPGLWQFYANRIVVYFTLSINYAFHNNAVGGYHVFNLFIHLLNGILFFTLLKKLFLLPYFKGKIVSRYTNAIPLLAALLFVCHPIQVNAVTYIIQRTASLAATFYFLSIIFFVNYRIQNKWPHLLATILFTIIAMFTKENTITIPFFLLFIELMFFMKHSNISWKKRIFIFILLFATIPIIPGTNLLLQGYSQSDPNLSFKASTSMDRLHYFYTQQNVILKYIRLMFVPIGQNFDYSNDFPLSTTLWENNSYLALLIHFLIVLYSIYAMKRNRLVSFGILWFYAGLAVESSFISIKDVYFEHRLYFPCAGFVLFLIGLITYQRKKGKQKHLFKNPTAILLSISITLIPIYTTLTIYRNYIYGDSIRLWSDVVGKAPGSDRAHNSLATGYLNAYDEEKENKEYLDLAETEFKKALSINSKNSTAHTNLSKVYLLKGEYQKCIAEARLALQLTKSEYAQFNIGAAYKKLGKTTQALDAFHEGYRYNSRSSFILKALGDTYYDMKDFKKAEKYYKEYLEHYKYLKNEDIHKKLDEINKLG